MRAGPIGCRSYYRRSNRQLYYQASITIETPDGITLKCGCADDPLLYLWLGPRKTYHASLNSTCRSVV